MSRSCWDCPFFIKETGYGYCQYGGCMEAMMAQQQKPIPATQAVLVIPDETELEISV